MDKTWKLLFYISADNNLYNDALVTLRQLTDAEVQNKVEIIVQLDGPTSDQVSRYKCLGGGSKELFWQAPDYYTSDRGTRLKDFLDIDEAKPSDQQKVALVLWGHGAGLDHFFFYTNPPEPAAPPPAILPLKVVRLPSSQSSEAQEVNRYVTNIQLAGILAGYRNKIGKKIDLLGLDSCLMGLVEICDEVSQSVSFMVASDEEVPNGSFPYDTILEGLKKDSPTPADALSKHIVDKFVEKYKIEDPKTRVSLSAIDLEKCRNLIEEMKMLVKYLDNVSQPTADRDGTVSRMIFRARDASRTPDEVTYIDLGVFCKELSESFSTTAFSTTAPELRDQAEKVRDQAKKVRNSLGSNDYPGFTLYHKDEGENGSIDPTGLAIYFPPTLDLITSQIDQALIQQSLPPNPNVKFPAALKTKFPAALKTKFQAALKTKFQAALKTKFEDGSQITGYEILWDHYKKLKFNRDTGKGIGWADLVYRLLGGKG